MARTLLLDRLARALDDRPELSWRGPVRVGREVVGWRRATWAGQNQVGTGTVLVGDVSVGAYSRFGPRTFVSGPVEVGRYCSMGADVGLIAGDGHPVHTAALFTSPSLLGGRRRPAAGPGLRIGHDVWIGHGATVVGDVRIGDGAVIGAQAFVARDVAPFTIVAGVPARPTRVRFAPEVVDLLERWAWWELEAEQLERFEDVLALDLTDPSPAVLAELRRAIAERPTAGPRRPIGAGPEGHGGE